LVDGSIYQPVVFTRFYSVKSSCERFSSVSSTYPQRDDGNWAIRFRNFDLGTLTDEGNEIRRSGLVRSSQTGASAATAAGAGQADFPVPSVVQRYVTVDDAPGEP